MIRIKFVIQSGIFRFLAVAGALATVAAIPSVAQVTFAQFIELNAGEQDWSITTSSCTVGGSCINGLKTTVAANGAVEFQFSNVPGSPVGIQDASFSLNATSYQVGNCGASCGPGDSLDQPGYAGTFSFTDTSAGAYDGDNLLSGTFAVTGSPSTTGAQFSSNVGGNGGSFDASATAGNLSQLIFTSAFGNLNGVTEETASFSLSSLNPKFATGTVTSNTAFPAAGPFTAAGSGTFSSDSPVVTPEPASFALIGGGLIGFSVLRRRKMTRS